MPGVSERRAWVLGQPVHHSLSPALHTAAFAAAGIAARYEGWEVDAAELPAVLRRLRAPDALGANVTAPHKQACMPGMDELSPEARLLGALNTIVNRGGRLVGDNTDAEGLRRWLAQADIAVAGRETVVLGAGGAARATVMALARAGARGVLVLNRTPARAERLVDDLRPALPGLALEAGPLDRAARPPQGSMVALVVNATSLGHQGSAPEVHPAWWSDGTVALDLAYNPSVTAFMRAATAAGARAENGLGMLVHQAALAFERWIGQPAPLAAYEAAAREALRERVAP